MTGETYELPTVSEPPETVWEAALTPILNEDDAVAQTRRLLESPFIGEHTEDMSIEAFERENGWMVYASQLGHAMPVTVWLSREGRVLMYENFRTVGRIPVGVMQYAHRSPLESVREYIQAFFRAELPGAEYRSCKIMDDIKAENMRYINLESENAGNFGEYLLTLQVEPQARVLAYLETDAPLPDGVQCAQDAQRIAALGLTEVFSLSHMQIDAGRFTAEYDALHSGWRVVFESSEAEIADKQSAARFEWLISVDGTVLECAEGTE